MGAPVGQRAHVTVGVAEQHHRLPQQHHGDGAGGHVGRAGHGEEVVAERRGIDERGHADDATGPIVHGEGGPVGSTP